MEGSYKYNSILWYLQYLLYIRERGGDEAIVRMFPTVMRMVDGNGEMVGFDHQGPC